MPRATVASVYLGDDWQLLEWEWGVTRTIKGLDSGWPDLLINALPFRAGRLENSTLSQTNKDGTGSSSWAGLPILLTPPSILITVNGFFAHVSRMLRRVWEARGVVSDLAMSRDVIFQTWSVDLFRVSVFFKCVDQNCLVNLAITWMSRALNCCHHLWFCSAFFRQIWCSDNLQLFRPITS